MGLPQQMFAMHSIIVMHGEQIRQIALSVGLRSVVESGVFKAKMDCFHARRDTLRT